MNYFDFILKCLRRYMYWSGKWRNWKRIMTASQCHQVVHSNPGRVLHPPSTPTSLPSNNFWFAQLSNTQSYLTPGLWNIREVWGCISPKERGYLCAELLPRCDTPFPKPRAEILQEHSPTPTEDCMQHRAASTSCPFLPRAYPAQAPQGSLLCGTKCLLRCKLIEWGGPVTASRWEIPPCRARKQRFLSDAEEISPFYLFFPWSSQRRHGCEETWF